MAYKAISNGYAMLAVALGNNPSTDTTLQVAAGEGDVVCPVISGSNHTYITLEKSGAIETVKVTARASGSDSMTVVRAQDGTSIKSWLVGDIVECRPCAAAVADLQAEFAAADAAHVSASDPHTQYALDADVAAALAAKQAHDDFLDALALLGTAADRLIYVNGANSAVEMVFNAAARLLLTDMKFSGVYGEKVNARGTISGTQAIDNSLGTYVTATIGGATNFATGGFTNPIASGYVGGFMLELTNGGSAAITWPTSVKWPGGTPPAFSASGVDILTFFTRDGGTTWRASLVQKGSA